MLLEAGGVVSLVLIALWLFALFDVISTDASMCRNLPKMFWLTIVLFLPDVGSIAWLLLGRPERAGWRPGDTTIREARRIVGPEDSNQWSPARRIEATSSAPDRERRMAELDAELDRRIEERRLKEWEDELLAREERLRAQEEGTDPTP